MPGIIGFPQFDPGYDFSGPPPVEEQEAATKPAPLPPSYMDAVEDYEAQQEQRLRRDQQGETDDSTGGQSTGQASGSDSDGQGSTGSSQTETRPDTGHATEELGAHEPPDIDEFGDGFGTEFGWIPSANLDQQSKYTSPDVMRVKQDIETRPLIFQHCFQHSYSPRLALEFIYAEPPKFSESELRYCQQEAKQQMRLRAGMADGGAGEADVTGFTNSRSVHRYKGHLKDKYGFTIEWGEAANETNMAGQLNNLAKSVAHIVNYLDVVYADDPITTGISVFQQYFSQNEHGQLNIQLGADAFFTENFENIAKEDAPNIGYVPLGGTINMYLGSMVDVPTIVHEFGHVIDRSLREDVHCRR